MADEQESTGAAVDIPAILEKRQSRADDDNARREAWLADKVARADRERARSAAIKRVRAAAYTRQAADPADVALALDDE